MRRDAEQLQVTMHAGLRNAGLRGDPTNLVQWVEVPQLLSNHPDNPHRVAALKQHFRENPKLFGSFSSDRKSAKPLVIPKDTSEKFLR